MVDCGSCTAGLQQFFSSATSPAPGASLKKQSGSLKADAMSIWDDLVEAPVDPILGTSLAYKADPDSRKVNLGIGAYRTEEGKPYVLNVVKRAEDIILAETKNGTIDKEYATVDGLLPLKALTQQLIFGGKSDRICSAQALSGTGAVRVAGVMMERHLGVKEIFISDPTWGNHKAIFADCGLKVSSYPYYDAATRSLKFNEMLAHLKNHQQGTYLLHACAHNPTGVDPTPEQWQQILDVCVANKHLVMLDSAYQGYASGSLEYDRKAVEMFYKSGLEFFVCQSFAKNLGLYGERIGMIHTVCKTVERAKIVLSQEKTVIRAMYSNPPIHGGHLVVKILGDPALYKEWTGELKMMADRILEVRKMLRTGLEKKKTPGTWNHVTDQIGMFSFTGLSVPQCERLIKEHHIYLLKTGRISLAGLNKGNIQYVINAIDEVVRTLPAEPSKL